MKSIVLFWFVYLSFIRTRYVPLRLYSSHNPSDGKLRTRTAATRCAHAYHCHSCADVLSNALIALIALIASRAHACMRANSRRITGNPLEDSTVFEFARTLVQVRYVHLWWTAYMSRMHDAWLCACDLTVFCC